MIYLAVGQKKVVPTPSRDPLLSTGVFLKHRDTYDLRTMEDDHWVDFFLSIQPTGIPGPDSRYGNNDKVKTNGAWFLAATELPYVKEVEFTIGGEPKTSQNLRIKNDRTAASQTGGTHSLPCFFSLAKK